MKLPKSNPSLKLCVMLFLLIISIKSYSQKKVISIDELITETQKGTDNPDEMKLIWWIPIEFWESIFDAEEAVTEDMKAEMINTLKPYVMFAIVDGNIGPFGGVTYKPFEDIKNSISLIDNQQNSYKPIETEDLNSDTQILVSSFKPILENMLGAMGENMHFFVFNDLDENNNRISDPTASGNVTIKIETEEYQWKTPLSAVTPSKVCPTDQAVLNGTWTYCPWHGTLLQEMN